MILEENQWLDFLVASVLKLTDLNLIILDNFINILILLIVLVSLLIFLHFEKNNYSNRRRFIIREINFSKSFSKKISFKHINTGSMYRAVTHFALLNGLINDDKLKTNEIIKLTETLKFNFKIINQKSFFCK